MLTTRLPMHKNSAILTMILTVLFLLILGNLRSIGLCWANEKPNILFCMADDWGWPHAGAYGDRAVKTPSFDRIAKEGLLFHHVYVSSPSCTPSRNAVITGKYHWQLGPGANLWSTLPKQHQSFIHILRDSGYVTGRSPAKTWGPGKIDDWVAHHGSHPATESFNTLDQFLETTDARQKPFFFWLATGDPHRPYTKGSGVKAGINLSKVHLFDHYVDCKEIRSDVADYYLEVQQWDQLVGKAIETLEQNGLLENTTIIMTGDHGMPFPRGKGNLYDSGVRVPFAVRWGKNVASGRTNEDFISFADIAPTLLEIADVSVPADMTGSSFAQILRSVKSGRLEPESRPDIVFGRERHTPAQEVPDTGGYPSRGLRNERYLYIRNYSPNRWPAGTSEYAKTKFKNQWFSDCDGGPTKNYIYLNRNKDEIHTQSYELCFARRPAEELFDLNKDPGQLKNVADNEDYRLVLETMRERLQKRLTELHDPRADQPGYTGFDGHPYFGGGGGKIPKTIQDQIEKEK
jgi:N-sulfoglucosamine sulfohydrolase